MTNAHTPRRTDARIARAAALCLLAFAAVLVQSRQASAQWTTSGNNISNTNSGNVGVGTTTPSTKLDVIGVTKSDGFNLNNTAAEKSFVVLWNNGVANQKVQVYWPASTQVDGIYEVTVTGHYWYSNSNGGIRKRIVINGRNIGIINMQQSEVPFRLGFTGNSDTISDIMWDAANSRYYLIVSNLDNAQNGITIHVKSITPSQTASNADTLNVTPIYTTDATVYPQLQTSIMGGNLGVGTNTPGYKLDVQGGQINASGGLCIAGVCKTDWTQVGGGSSQWTTSGTSVYYNTGNVGIGTSSPGASLDIAGNPLSAIRTSYLNISASNGVAGDRPYIRGTNTHLVVNGYGANTGGTLYLNYPGDLAAGQTTSTRLQETLFVSATGSGGGGNVGVGTSTPLAGMTGNAGMELYAASAVATLRIKTGLAGKNNAQVRFAGASGDNWAIGSDVATHSGSRDFHFYDFAGTPGARLTIQSATGNVGIGTTNPVGKLNIVDGGHLSIYTTQGYGPTFAKDGLTVMSNPDSGYSSMVIKSGHSMVSDRGLFRVFRYDGISPQQEMLYVRMDGNVGFGTLTPGYRVDVQGGQVNASGGLCIAGDCKTAWSQVGGGSSQWATSGTSISYSGGNVGVGNSAPGSQLFVGSGTPSVATLPGLNVALGPNSGAYIAASNNTVNTFIGSDTSAYGIVGTLSNHPLGLRANNTLAVTVATNGNVGIGTQTPGAKLDVQGDINVTGNINAKYQDVAEWVPSSQKLAAGTVVILDPARSNHVLASTSAYDTAVAGVVSEKPGIALGERGEGKALVATTGRVRVRVDASRGPIRIGDLLVTSDVEGVAMKSEPVNVGGRRMHAPGTIIGKALEPLESGTGEILVLLSLQ